MKRWIGQLTLFVITLTLLGSFASPAFGAGAANSEPATSSYIDGQSHSINNGQSLWFRFNYAGDRSHITVTMPNGYNSGIAFNVFTPEQAQDWWEAKPIGRGTSLVLDCDTGDPAPYGGCQSNDLTWDGQFNAQGTYYVQVINNNPNASSFTLTIEGTGVSVPPPAPAVVPQPPAPRVVLPVSGRVPPINFVFPLSNRRLTVW